MTSDPTPSPADAATAARASVRRRSLVVLSLGQVLGGIGIGSTIALGGVITERLTGSESFAGLPTAAVTLGAAALAVPLAALARRSGRRPSLALGMTIALVGVVLVVLATGLASVALLLTAFALVGGGQAVNLQSRFAATDLASDRTRGRDLAVVVWATTIGAVVGPNLVAPGEALGELVGMPELTGPYLFTGAAQLLAIALYLVFLRPDPLLLSRRGEARPGSGGTAVGRASAPDRPHTAAAAMIAVAGAHAVMIIVMSVTSVHLIHHGAGLTVVGLTISLHVAGMFALSPVFGILADRVGRPATVVLGGVLLAVALLVGALGATSTTAVTVSLVLLGLGWSAATVAGSALLTEASAPGRRTVRQGRSDALMNLVGAGGAAVAGMVLGLIGFAGLAAATAGLLVGVALLAAGVAARGSALAPVR